MWLEIKHQEVLMTYPFENFTLWEIVARKPDFAAVSSTHDMHRLSLLIRSFARAFFFVFKKRLIPRNVTVRKALAWMTEIKTHIRECQCIIKTSARLLTGHGKSSKTNVSFL